MKTKIIDGVECEVISDFPSEIRKGVMCLSYRPLPKPKKTLAEIAKSFFKSEERFGEEQLPMQAAVYDAIEERLKALEEAAKC